MQEWTVCLTVEYLPLPMEQLAAWLAGWKALMEYSYDTSIARDDESVRTLSRE